MKPGIVRSAVCLAAFCSLFATGSAFVACSDDVPVAPLDGGNGDATTGDASAEAGACTPYDAGPLDNALVGQGKTLVAMLKCPSCHAGNLSGNSVGVDSPTTEGGTAYPPNLTSDPTTGLGCWTNEQIERAFLHGIDNEGNLLCPPMPHFADAGVDQASADAIVAFLRSLPHMVSRVPPTPACSQLPAEDAAGGEDAADAEGDGPSEDATTDAGAPDADGGVTTDASTRDAPADAPPDVGSEDAGADVANGDGGGEAGVSDGGGADAQGDAGASDGESDAARDGGADAEGDGAVTDGGTDAPAQETGSDAAAD
jgi:hypothetical protein